MRLALCLCLLATPSFADCADDIRAMYDPGGAHNPFTRPPHRQVQTILNADGSEVIAYHGMVEDPLHTISGVVGGDCVLVADTTAWQGPCFDGPWSKMDAPFPADRNERLQAEMDHDAANFTDAECLGPDEVNGTPVEVYRWRTHRDANHGGPSGGLYTAYVDAETNRWLRVVIDETVQPWAPEPSDQRVDTVIEYDETITVRAPE